MRAILNNDLIVSYTVSETEGVEIGTPPKNIGLERLRFNGSEIVDIATLSAFWVEKRSEGFVLHCVEVPGSTYLEFDYADRKLLIINGGSLRLKTIEEVDAEQLEIKIKVLKNKLRLKLLNSIGDTQDQNMNTLAFVCALIIYVRNQPPALADFFDEIIPDIIDIFPLATWKETLKAGAKDLKTAMQEYYEGIQNYGDMADP